jgi:hypothetical protein
MLVHGVHDLATKVFKPFADIVDVLDTTLSKGFFRYLRIVAGAGVGGSASANLNHFIPHWL